MIVQGEIERSYLPLVFGINRETYLKILGVNFHSDPIKWDQLLIKQAPGVQKVDSAMR